MDRRQFLKASVAVSAATAVGVKAAQSVTVSNVQPEDVRWKADFPEPTKIRAIFLSPEGEQVAESVCKAVWINDRATLKLTATCESAGGTFSVSRMRLVPGPGAGVTEKMICSSPAAECDLVGRWLDYGGTAPVLLTPHSSLTVEYPIYVEAPLGELL